MSSRFLGLAMLSAGCMAAAAGGGYLAMRNTAATQPPVFAAAESSPAAAQPDQPVILSGGEEASAAPVSVEVSPPVTQPAVGRKTRRTPAAPVSRSARRTEFVRREPPRAADASETALPAPEASPLPAAAAAPDGPVSLPESPEPVAPTFRYEEIVVPSETVIGVQVDTTVNSELSRVEDRVEGHVTRDVAVGGRVAIPAGTKLIGAVTIADRGGKFKERSRVAVRFHTAQLSDGSRVALTTTAVMREGDPPSRETAAKVGGSAVGGAILGAILGGTKGAVIGGTAGAGAGTAAVMASGRNAATLPAGTAVTIRLMSDVAITVER